MRRVFWQMMVSLDGFGEGPNGELDWHVVDEDFHRYVEEMGKTIDAMIFGRVTYEMMAAYWPTATEPEARFMNELPKVVFSKTLDKVDWQNARLVKDNVAEEVRKLKEQPGKDVAIFGSADLASDLLQMGLIDEVRMMINPLVLGAGKPMFKDVKGPIKLKLTKSETSSGGNVNLYYEPERAASASA